MLRLEGSEPTGKLDLQSCLASFVDACRRGAQYTLAALKGTTRSWTSVDFSDSKCASELERGLDDGRLMFADARGTLVKSPWGNRRTLQNNSISDWVRTFAASDPRTSKAIAEIERRMASREATTVCVQTPEAGHALIAVAPLTNDLWTVYVTDVTALKRAEQAAIAERANADAARTATLRMLALVSHELRTLVNSTINLSENLADGANGLRRRETARLLRSSGHALARVANDMIDVSKLELEQFDVQQGPIDVRELVAEIKAVHAIQARRKALSLSCKIADDVPTSCMGDATRIRQIVSNLLGNAIKFTSSGGVELTVEMHAINGDAQMVWTVRDSGPGVSASDRATVFAPFLRAPSTAGVEGAGLGLHLSRKLATLMGGRLELLPTEGPGAVFQLSLPLTETKASARDVVDIAEVKPMDCKPCASKRVMIVDDNATNRMIFSTFLKARDGLDVITAADGDEAVAKHRTFLPDVVLMDLTMPGMDGCTATAAIRAQEAEMGANRSIIVAVTAHAIRGDRNRCLEAGMDEFLSKPVSKQQLLEFLDACLKGDAQPKPKPYTGPDRRSSERSAGTAKDRRTV